MDSVQKYGAQPPPAKDFWATKKLQVVVYGRSRRPNLAVGRIEQREDETPKEFRVRKRRAEKHARTGDLKHVHSYDEDTQKNYDNWFPDEHRSWITAKKKAKSKTFLWCRCNFCCWRIKLLRANNGSCSNRLLNLRLSQWPALN